jgi:hypothetical protein
MADILRGRVMDKLRAEARRQVERQTRVLMNEAQREAADIVKAAQREANNKARMLEKAKTTREARRAQKAVQAADTDARPPALPDAPPWESAAAQPQGAYQEALDGVDAAPWD